jgi:hypothetical protein
VSGEPLLSPSIRKEVRALLPTWVSFAFLIVASPLLSMFRVRVLMLAYALGVIQLGAQVIGHEYTNRTLTLMLSQPRDRRRVLATKLGVLAMMVVALGIMALAVTPPAEVRGIVTHARLVRGLTLNEWSVFGWAAASALFLAPCLSLLCRGSLPAIVFTLAIPGVLGAAARPLGVAVFGLHNAADVDTFQIMLLSWTMFAVLAVAGVATWRLFTRLEAIDGHGPDIELPMAFGSDAGTALATAPRRRHPIWLLTGKELRLQQMTFVVVALFALAWTAAAAVARYAPESVRSPHETLTILYACLLAVLIGSLSSAEERQFGTHQWQILQPVAMWKQWSVKAGVVLGLTILFGIAVPMLLNYLLPLELDERFAKVMLSNGLPILALIAAGSLYISSISASGVRAMVLSLPVLTAGAVAIFTARDLSSRFALSSLTKALGGVKPTLGPDQIATAQSVQAWIWIAIELAFIALLLRFALANHRSAERSIRRIVAHAAGILVFIVVGAALPAAVWAYFVTR